MSIKETKNYVYDAIGVIDQCKSRAWRNFLSYDRFEQNKKETDFLLKIIIKELKKRR